MLSTVHSASADTGKTIASSAIEQTVRQALPNTPISSIQATPIEGLLEIVAGRNVLYTDPTGRYLVLGNIYDMHTATDLTAERKAAAFVLDWDRLPLETAVHYGSNGPQKLAVFFDPGCAWCKELHWQLASLNDVEVYAILYPVSGMQETQAATILCSADPFKALDDVMSGVPLPEDLDPACLAQANTALAQVQAFARDHSIHGTPTLVAPDGRVQPGFMQAKEIKAWLSLSR